ncbi:S1/P1 nuclease-domain-containing protein [Paraphysoderma sedebokerense]|nr:S1/P1 nuclease-domain-containing protein [Paraphysoderma sedebokerense]
MRAFLLLSLLLFIVPAAVPWGYKGHQLTAQIAQQFLNPEAESGLRTLLPNEEGDISKIASWADQIKRNRKYQHTAPLHYVDTNDDPPNSCSYQTARDCSDNKCVVSAIKDYASQVSESSESISRTEALKFLVHFVGDIHQPLHVSGKDRGGNSAPAYFDGRRTNLHFIWDSLMLEKRIKETFGNNRQEYVQYLNTKLHKELKDEALEWTKCSSKLQINSNGSIREVDVCPEDWAATIGQVNCASVWHSYNRTSTDDLALEYFEKNQELVDKLVLMSGIRLANVLNELFGIENIEDHAVAGEKFTKDGLMLSENRWGRLNAPYFRRMKGGVEQNEGNSFDGMFVIQG